MSLNQTELEGQQVVVLGGTSGIGLATAAAAAAAGAEITVVSSQKASVERALAELPAGTAGYPVDLTDAAAVRALFGDLGDIDHLIFTAGESLSPQTLGPESRPWPGSAVLRAALLRGAHCGPGRRSPPSTGRFAHPHHGRRAAPASARVVGGGQRHRSRRRTNPGVGGGAGPPYGLMRCARVSSGRPCGTR